MVPVLGQVSATGTEPAIAVAVLVLWALSVVLSVAIAVVLVRGYRRGPGQRAVLLLAVGLLFLTTVPELLRVGLPTVTGVGTAGQSVVSSGCELFGLGIILWAVYGGESQS